LSDTVQAVLNVLGADRQVSAMTIVEHIMERHPEYGNGQGLASSALNDAAPSLPVASAVKSVTDWYEDVIHLYVSPPQLTKLHGKLVVLGLCLLDEQVARRLTANGQFQAMRLEVTPTWSEQLSVAGKSKYTVFVGAVRFLDDGPVSAVAADRLGRDAFARVLEIIIRRTMRERTQERALLDMHPPGQAQHRAGTFTLHVDGPWGAGKTTVLNLLKARLAAPLEEAAGLGEDLTAPESQPWIVVQFNAWRQERLGTPWWWLMNAVYTQSSKQLWPLSLKRITLWRRHTWWRVKREALYLLAVLLVTGIAGLIWAGAGILGWKVDAPVDTPLKSITDLAEAVTKVSAAIAVLFTFVIGIMQVGSRRATAGAVAAQSGHQDPMGDVRRHFDTLIRTLGERRVAVFVDDLDRCQGPYVVEFLEGMQTLFAESGLAYVIAADGAWLRTSYETAYAAFTDPVGQPGRPLGYLFLDKAIQLTAPIPKLTHGLEAAYWGTLLQLPQEGEGTQQKGAQRTLPVSFTAAAQEAQWTVTSTAAMQIRSELAPFAPLLDANPRAMKRLLNAYQVQRAVTLLSGVAIEMKPLALWTIFQLRRPLLAAYLILQPEALDRIRAGPPAGTPTLAPVDLPRELTDLARSDDVRNVIGGKGVDATLTAETLRRLMGVPSPTP
jgi:hypothetical protein